MARRNPFLDTYNTVMETAFADMYGAEGNPFGDYLSSMGDEAQQAYRQRARRAQRHDRNYSQKKFFNRSAFGPDSLQAQYEQFGGGTPGKRGPRDPGEGFTPPTGWQPGPLGGPDPNDNWQNTNPEAGFRKHLTGLGFDPQNGQGAFDDWLRGQFGEANLDYGRQLRDNASLRWTDYLGQNWNDPQAIRQRFYSMDPSRRGEGSQRYVGPGRTILF